VFTLVVNQTPPFANRPLFPATAMKQIDLLSFGAVIGVANAKCDPDTIQAALPEGAGVNFAYSLTANSTFEVPRSNTGYPTNAVNLPGLCAVSIQVQSIANSTYGFGLFLPDDWNGRFLAVGNGGFGGGINYVDMVRDLESVRLSSAESS
jgi:feruloyl esterase